jgi:hypothetical protein
MAYSDHAVTAVSDTDWRSSKDGPLLAFAAQNFDVFVTIDRGLVRQNAIEKPKPRLLARCWSPSHTPQQ